jgi:DNA invertase Pin-like site-specific DNA recombinase
LEELNRLGVKFVSYQEHIDLTTPSGKLMFHIVAAMAEFERELIRERVKAGISNARAKGQQIGRKPLPSKVIDRIVILRGEGMSVRQIAKEVNVSIGGVHKTLKIVLS